MIFDKRHQSKVVGNGSISNKWWWNHYGKREGEKRRNVPPDLNYIQTLRWILDLNVKMKMIKLLEESKRLSSWPKGRGRQKFSRQNTELKTIKEKHIFYKGPV